MIYSKGTPGNGVWHCPFSPEWVERMKHAAKVCQWLTVEQIEAAYNREVTRYRLPPGDFLDGPQDARGLPLSYCREEELRYRNHPTCCTAIYDYDNVPDMVVSNGEEDWSLRLWETVLTA